MKFFISEIPVTKDHFGLQAGNVYEEEELRKVMPPQHMNLWAKEGWMIPFEREIPGVPIPDFKAIREPIDLCIRSRKERSPIADINGESKVIGTFGITIMPRIIVNSEKMDNTGLSIMVSPIGDVFATLYFPVILSEKLGKIGYVWTKKTVYKFRIFDEEGEPLTIFDTSLPPEELENLRR